jgi:hypothetical protein
VVRFANEVAEADVVPFAVALPELGGLVVSGDEEAEDCAAEGVREKERRERRERKRE